MWGTAAALMTSLKDRDKKKYQVANSGRLLQWPCNMLRLLRVNGIRRCSSHAVRRWTVCVCLHERAARTTLLSSASLTISPGPHTLRPPSTAADHLNNPLY